MSHIVNGSFHAALDCVVSFGDAVCDVFSNAFHPVEDTSKKASLISVVVQLAQNRVTVNVVNLKLKN